MSANGMSRVFTPVVQGKDQHNSMNNMQNHSTGNNTSVPVTGTSFTGGSFFSGNSVNAPPPQFCFAFRAQAITLPLASGEIPASDHGAGSAAVAAGLPATA
uniref:Uncharacterized protein n=1 Tax=Setaria italica TaxID=4555 RepID=K3ZB40_SETIT